VTPPPAFAPHPVTRRTVPRAAIPRAAVPRATSRGAGLLVAAAVLLAAGFWYGYPELTVLGAAGLIASVTAVAHTAWQPRLGVARVADPDRVPRGEPSVVTLTVTNGSRLRSATLLAQDRCGTATVPVPVLRLRPKRETTASYPVPTDRRGVVLIGPLRVTRRDPLGLAGLSRERGGTTQVWVYPRIHPLGTVPAGVARSMDGRLDRVPHGSITFDSLREYVVGDELRRVHWRTTARVGELMVREHLDTSLPRIVVLLDDRAASHADPETFESACEAAASVVAAAVREDLAVTLHLAGGRAAGTGGRTGGTGGRAAGTGGRTAGTGSRDFLDLLAEATLHSGVELGTAANRLRQQRLGDTLVYLTGPGGRGDLGLIGALRGAYPSVVVGVFGAAEPTSAGGGLVVLDAEDGAAFAAQWDGVTAW
jgi:uncharacterized protein (DUF58 family)